MSASHRSMFPIPLAPVPRPRGLEKANAHGEAARVSRSHYPVSTTMVVRQPAGLRDSTVGSQPGTRFLVCVISCCCHANVEKQFFRSDLLYWANAGVGPDAVADAK
jgi:hypothetical protein